MVVSKTPKAYSYIRFSTPEQKKGDSLRRQIELSKEYADKNGLILDEKLKMEDQGLSAFKGHHKTKGALGEFLKLVEQGEIPQGSVLIVENLDRLSREQVLDALNQFTSIIKAGISIVTLQDNMKYSVDSINNNWAQLIISITYMARAHEESLAKSKRLSASWEQKRKKLTTQNDLMTRRLPAWLEFSEDKKKIIPIPEICEAMKLIFLKKKSGKGAIKTVRELNVRDDIWKPPVTKKNKSGGWQISYVNRILTNRQMIGEFQPHKYINKKRVPHGDAIKNYYPKIVSKDLFYEVQSILKANSKKPGNAGGRQQASCSNLFTHLVKCGLCGGPLHFINKSLKPKHQNRKYLSCANSRRLNKCSARSIQYNEFERLFFDNFEELDIKQLIPDTDETSAKLATLNQKVKANSYRINEIDNEMENLADSISITKDSRIRKYLDKKMVQVFDEQDQLKKDNKKYRQELQELSLQKMNLNKNMDHAKEIYQLLESTNKELEKLELRFRLKEEIRKIVEVIDIYPLQVKYKKLEEIKPGIVQWMESRSMDKVRIKFKGIKKKRLLLLRGCSGLPLLCFYYCFLWSPLSGF